MCWYATRWGKRTCRRVLWVGAAVGSVNGDDKIGVDKPEGDGDRRRAISEAKRDA